MSSLAYSAAALAKIVARSPAEASNFRSFLTPCLFAAFWVLNVSISESAAAQPLSVTDGDMRPNIIFILADDLGYGDLGSYGQARIETPTLDRMARNGMRFTQFYAGGTVCKPSRCVLMTGLHTGHCYLRGNLEVNLPPETVTLAETLKKANYTTGVIGKWALGSEGSTSVPTKQGFDYFYGYLNQTHAHNYYPHFLIRNESQVALKNVVPNPGIHGEGVATRKIQYSHDLLTHEALAFIDRNKDRNFFLYLAYTIPHANNEAGENGMEVPDLGVYADKDWRGYKGDLYDGGIRVPMIVRWPGKVPSDSVSGHVGYFADILPTLAELAGVDPAPGIDGVSFLPILLDQAEQQRPHRYLYWEFYEQGGSRAVRMGDWKAVRRPFFGDIELYDLKTDIGERNDLAKRHPEIVEKINLIMEDAHIPSPIWEVSCGYGRLGRIKTWFCNWQLLQGFCTVWLG